MADTSIFQQYPQLHNDAEFMRLYQQLQNTPEVLGRHLAENAPRVQLATALTKRAQALGLPADRVVNTAGHDESIHATRNFLIKAAIVGGATVATLGAAGAFGAAGGAGTGSLGGGVSGVASTVAPTAATGATTAAPTVTSAAGTVLPVSALPAAGAPLATATGPTAASATPTIANAVAPAAKSVVPWGKIIGAGLQIGSNYLQGRAQNKAIDAQSQANIQAQAQIKAAQDAQVARIDRNQETQRQLYSPYTSLGASASGTLGSRMGFPSTPAPASGMAATTPIQSTGGGLHQGTVSLPTGQPNTPAPGSLASASQGMPAQQPGTPIAQIGAAAQQQTAQNSTQSGYVTMLAPDGTQGQVPQHQVEFYRQKGAQVVQ